MRYILKQRFWSFGDDYNIQDESGKTILKVDNKIFSLRKKLVIKNPEGLEIGYIVKKAMAFRSTFLIYREEKLVATIKQKSGLFRKKLVIDLENGEYYTVKGDLVRKEYSIRKGMHRIAEVSKKWFLQMTDTYAIKMEEGSDKFVLLCAAIVIDLIANKARKAPEANVEKGS